MRKLALSDEILMSVDKSARYIGNEVNSVLKNPSSVDIRFAFCFPDVYEIGMSHLGIQILYDMFNQREDVYCERVYSPWPDLHKIMKEQHLPLFALESQDAIKDFDFIGITLQYEMCYTNVLALLDLALVPLLAKERTDDDPLVIAGGPCTYNPEPLADFFDIFYIGEGEISFDEIFDLYKIHKKKGFHRQDFLQEVATIPGIYVPSFYEVDYHTDGTISSFHPSIDNIPSTIKRVIVNDFDKATYPANPVVPFVQATQDRVVLEIQRGCIRGCRFCQAGMVYRPNREKSISLLKKYAKEMLDSTGHDEISLSSLSSSDYSNLEELIQYLMDECCGNDVNISLPSLRIDAFSLDVMKKVQDIRKSSLTFAPEAGTQRLRNVINKGLTKEDILHGSEMAFLGGWNKVKLYFMLGLPTEEIEDQKAIPELANEIAALYYETVPKENRQGKCQITISTSFFVPKPFTPFQWAKMFEPGDYLGFAKTVNETLKEQLNQKSIKYQWHQADVTVLEGIFARGDRKIGQVILYAYQHGAMFDAWNEYFDYPLWMESFHACGIDPNFYTLRERSLTEILPWDFIDIGVKRSFLENEWKKSKEETITLNCREKCNACGCMEYQGGICNER